MTLCHFPHFYTEVVLALRSSENICNIQIAEVHVRQTRSENVPKELTFIQSMKG
jgi:hypothetical protein